MKLSGIIFYGFVGVMCIGNAMAITEDACRAKANLKVNCGGCCCPTGTIYSCPDGRTLSGTKCLSKTVTGTDANGHSYKKTYNECDATSATDYTYYAKNSSQCSGTTCLTPQLNATVCGGLVGDLTVK